MRVFVTGGGGFVGTAVIEELVGRGHQIRALVHRRPITVGGDRVHSVPGDLFDPDSLDHAIAGCEAVVHLVGIIMEDPAHGATFPRMHVLATQNVLAAARRADIRRYVHMSALGTRPDAVSEYHKTKNQAEQWVRNSALEWTIFRPSMIHGPAGEFMRMEADWARGKAPPFLFMPYFGAGLLGRGGAGKLQPVFVGDVAKAFADALQNPKTIGEVYLLAGPDVLTWPQLHHTVAEAVVGHKRMVAALPVWYARMLTSIVPRRLLPFNRDQIIMSQENNTADVSKFIDAFGWKPQPFVASLQAYADRLR